MMPKPKIGAFGRMVKNVNADQAGQKLLMLALGDLDLRRAGHYRV
jgi:hypothetical protein